MAVCASYGIKICLITQTITQLYQSYTREQSIMGNCHTQVIFTPNQDGGNTARIIAESLGKETILSETRNDGGGGFGKGSRSTSGMGKELMAAYELGKMPFEREIVMVARNNPIYGVKLLYYEVPIFKKRSELPPPVYSDKVRSVASFNDLKVMIRPVMQEMREAQEKVRLAKEQDENFWQSFCNGLRG